MFPWDAIIIGLLAVMAAKIQDDTPSIALLLSADLGTTAKKSIISIAQIVNPIHQTTDKLDR